MVTEAPEAARGATTASRARAPREAPATRLTRREPMGRARHQFVYQPTLDGIRAVAVAAVILYHAGFDWMHGGFFGVEVFFVVSGYLITSLLIDERTRDGTVSLRQFWLRRARRLLPALFTMLVAVALWASFFGEEHLAQLRKDVLPGIFYVSNWAQIVGDVPYFAPGAPLLRHLWSLAVEEQWYLLWPLAFVGIVALAKGRLDNLRVPIALVAASVASMLFSIALTLSDEPTVSFAGQNADRYNFLYLNTLSRASGLLLGASLAFWWRPWARTRTRAGHGRRVDVAALVAIAAILVISVAQPEDVLASASLYRLWLPLVTVLSAVAVAAAVDPESRLAHTLLANKAVVEIGKRSYGLYLWHWPVFVFADVRAHHARFVPAILVAVALSELCYRFVETPVRSGALKRWWDRTGAHGRERRAGIAGLYVLACVVVAGTLGARLATADEVDIAEDESTDVVFDASVIETQPATTLVSTAPAGSSPAASDVSVSTPASSAGSGVPSPTGDADPTAAPVTTVVPTTAAPVPTAPLPRRVVVVGDSQAHSLAVNLPDGIESTFVVENGAVTGCGVQSEGRVVSARSGFRRSFGDCVGWEEKWGDAAASASAQIGLVVIGAWDVFDLEIDGRTVAFGSAEGDELFVSAVRRGVEALNANGAHAALLEVPCMRPKDVEGAGVPALPERGDDARVAHLNDLLRRVAAEDPAGATFVAGPTEWCSDEAIANDLGYRWDGVHVYKPGAKLIFETIASALLAIPV